MGRIVVVDNILRIQEDDRDLSACSSLSLPYDYLVDDFRDKLDLEDSTSTNNGEKIRADGHTEDEDDEDAVVEGHSSEDSGASS
jgi:hypothetical protein